MFLTLIYSSCFVLPRLTPPTCSILRMIKFLYLETRRTSFFPSLSRPFSYCTFFHYCAAYVYVHSDLTFIVVFAALGFNNKWIKYKKILSIRTAGVLDPKKAERVVDSCTCLPKRAYQFLIMRLGPMHSVKTAQMKWMERLLSISKTVEYRMSGWHKVQKQIIRCKQRHNKRTGNRIRHNNPRP